MATIRELQEAKNVANGHVNDMLKKFDEQGKKWLDDEQRSAFEAAGAAYNAANAELRSAQDAETVSEMASRLADEEQRSARGRNIPGREDSRTAKAIGAVEESSGFTDVDYNKALAGWMRGQNYATTEERSAMNRVGLTFAEREPFFEARHFAAESPETRSYISRQVELRALTTQTNSTGGYTIATTVLPRIEKNMLTFGGIRNVAETITTSTGEPMTWPTFDDTSNTGSQLDENTAAGAATDPTFGAVTWNAYKISSDVMKVPFELLQDSQVDIAGIVEDALGERLGRKTNSLYTTAGTGTNEAKSIIGAASSGVTTAGATAITAAEIMALIHSVDPAYRSQNAGFMMHDNVLLYIRQMVDSNGRPLYVSGMTDGMPDRLYGFPVTVNQSMASSVAATNKTMIFGKLSAYKIRRVGGIRLYRLEERYRDADQTGFVAFVREDGDLLTSTTKPVKYLTQHA